MPASSVVMRAPATTDALLVILAVVLVAVFGAARLSRKSASEMPVLVDGA